MPNFEELFTRRFGGGKRTYYLDVKRDTNGDKYIVISESTRKEPDRKLRSRVMVWREDFRALFEAMREMEDYLEATDSLVDRSTATSAYIDRSGRAVVD